jgi:hypothetical protein
MFPGKQRLDVKTATMHIGKTFTEMTQNSALSFSVKAFTGSSGFRSAVIPESLVFCMDQAAYGEYNERK